MKISCLMPTYNRFPKDGWMVQEAVQCFVDQDYPDKELLILNDTPDQLLINNHNTDQIKIINTNDRFPNLGAKITHLISISTGEACCRWDDDVISLPHRLSYSVGKLKDNLEWHAENYWFKNGQEKAREILKPGNTHLMSIFRKSILEKFSYPTNCCGAEDQAFTKLIVEHNCLTSERIPLEEIFYVYRWGTNSIHLSGIKDMQAHWDLIGQQPIEKGVFALGPTNLNYSKLKG